MVGFGGPKCVAVEILQLWCILIEFVQRKLLYERHMHEFNYIEKIALKSH